MSHGVSKLFFYGKLDLKLIVRISSHERLKTCQTHISSSQHHGLCLCVMNHHEWHAHSVALLTHCGLVTSYGCIISFNIFSGNGLLHDDTKPLPEKKLNHQQDPVAFIWGQFLKRYLRHHSPSVTKLTWKLLFKNVIHISQWPMS